MKVRFLSAIAGVIAIVASADVLHAADDLPAKAASTDASPSTKAAKPIPDLPLFFVNDNRLSYSFLPKGTDPGVYQLFPDGRVDGKVAKDIYSFTHFDAWAYGTNFMNLNLLKSRGADPANGCAAAEAGGVKIGCVGATDLYGVIRSTIGFNEVFNTKMFSWGPLRNVSLELGADFETENTPNAPTVNLGAVGLQFQFALPYHGFFNVAPLYYKQVDHSAFAQCGGPLGAGIPGVTCTPSGNYTYTGQWAIETNYYMDLGFLPESVRYFSISGRAAVQGNKGLQKEGLPYNYPNNLPTATKFDSEPIRLTFDAGKAFFGPKQSHVLDLWVSYLYTLNTYQLDAANSPTCNIYSNLGPTGVPLRSNGTCVVSSIYMGATVKF
jgi:hypothetical protein